MTAPSPWELPSTVRIAGPWAALAEHTHAPRCRHRPRSPCANKITALVQGHPRQSRDAGPQHPAEDKEPRDALRSAPLWAGYSQGDVCSGGFRGRSEPVGLAPTNRTRSAPQARVLSTAKPSLRDALVCCAHGDAVQGSPMRSPSEDKGQHQCERAHSIDPSGGEPFPCLWRRFCRAKAVCKGHEQVRHSNSLVRQPGSCSASPQL